MQKTQSVKKITNIICKYYTIIVYCATGWLHSCEMSLCAADGAGAGARAQALRRCVPSGLKPGPQIRGAVVSFCDDEDSDDNDGGDGCDNAEDNFKVLLDVFIPVLTYCGTATIFYGGFLDFIVLLTTMSVY